jgi:integrase
VNVDKKNKNKKCPVYTETELVAMLTVSGTFEEALIRFLVGTGFRIGEAAVAQWKDINWRDKTVSVDFKPELGFRPKDYERRTVEIGDVLLECLERHSHNAPADALLFSVA